jgi:hypothetical protein
MNYTNIPYVKTSNGNDNTIQVFSSYYSQPLELNAGVFDAMVGFFTSKGFDNNAAQSIAVTIIAQAKTDNYNPMTVLDSLKGLDAPTLNALVTEVINHNRFKTSFLGYSTTFTSVSEVARHILA